MFKLLYLLTVTRGLTLNTKQIVTLGPSCSSYNMLHKLHSCGVNIFRINMSHIKKHEDAQKLIDSIKNINKNSEHKSEIMVDLQGPKFRIGKLKTENTILEPGKEFILDCNPEPGDSTRVYLPHKEIFYHVIKNDIILIDDGLIKLKVTHRDEYKINTVVETGGHIKQFKGVNIPYVDINWRTLTGKDIKDLDLVNKNKIDWVALSYVQSHKDIINLWKNIYEPTKIIAKIECSNAVEDINNIIEFSHGIMIARGDLAIEVGYEKIPFIQKKALKLANMYNTEAIVATQMMESMRYNNVPTRAEVSDVANAVSDGATGVMLSAETSIGKYPIECVEIQRKILKESELYIPSKI